MENLSHSRNPNRSSLLPKKPYNGNNNAGGFSYNSGKAANTTTTTTYDDVFGGPPRFGAPTLSPRLEDYCEIFAGFNGSSRAAVSSIPVLDLPLVDDRDVYFDVRSQGFDYREVFGGFNDLDSAPSYEELFLQQRSPVVGDGDSSDDAWTPEEVESCSGGTEHSGKSPCFSNGRDSYDSIDGSTEFNISYNKASQISGGDTNMSSSGVIRVADLGAIPGYTVAVDGTTKLKKETGPSSVGRGTSKFVFEDKYYSSEPFVTVSEIGLKTHPTGIPPPSRAAPILKSDFRSSASNSKSTGSQGSADSSSPPFFDVEVDANSAAVREAMVKAEAKLKSAKELLERKRDGARTTAKPTSTKNRITEEGKSSHTAGLPVVKTNIDVARKSLRDKRGSQSLSSQGSANSDGNDEWKEANQFVELVRTELPRNADENSGGKDVSVPLNAEFFDQELTWAANVDWEKQRRRAKGDREDHEARKLQKHHGTRKVASRHKRHENKLAEKAPEEPKKEKSRHVDMGTNLPDHGGIVKHRNLLRPEENKLFTEKPAKQKKELHYEEKTKGIQNQQSDKIPNRQAVEKNQEFVYDWEQNARKLREALGNESTLEVSLELNGNGKKMGMCGESETKLNEALKRMEEETRTKEACVKEENDRREREAFEKAENEKRLKAALEREEKERKIKEAREKAENERRAVEAREKAEQELKMKEQQELELRLKEAFEKEEKNRRMREAREKADHERKMRVALEQEKERRIKEAREKEENERRIKEAREKAELEQRLKATLEQEEKERQIKECQEREENERRAKEVLEQAEHERKLKEALEQKEKERRLKETREKEENEKKLKEAIELEEKEKRLIEAFERAEIERRLKEDLEQEEMRMRLQEAKEREERERLHRENQEHQEKERKQHEYSGEESDEKERDACEMEKTCETTKEAHGEQSSNESLSDTLEEDESIDNHKSMNEQNEEEEGPRQRESMSQETCPWKVFEKNLKDASQKEGTNELDAESRLFERNEETPQLGENGGYNQQNGESSEESTSVTENIIGGKLQQKSKNSETSKDASVPKRDNGLKTEVEERSEDDVGEDQNVRKASVGRDQRNPEESKSAPKTSSGFRNHENKFTHQQERGNIYETQAGLNQDAKLERPFPSRVSVQREKEAERLKRERDLEMEQLRKVEEEREREREREKDRMAFDQRALADARERLEKACAEAREKSLPDKLSMEARLRAERVAVERATAEARERAAEKAAFEARERMERSVSDKQCQSSGFFGERMERSVSDKQFQNSLSFGASRYQNSTGTEAESPQRYTSRLERHRRTADRVAKALAEKNMRDLVAQREQTERIRIAETLDTEVKRWSSGKEGNIRALLSTLQYILGPESGWQPLPLTEVITSAAVKRAYRKATLCVHPDKLQQRGANIHQKYICEKVFDLLKEAWNRFNSEER
ncbi:Chaperone J-domain superfamily [Arabidopsis suecica]|uniref:Chaperone J-domain superfamily n=1 Tax=Arabidopsis suecica TaxID=45249 RepID=A0A8T1YFF6_ARASU|nr:Chaperone J-domain superfamily [Arabidopsis suecica]